MPIVGIKELQAALPPKTRLLGIDHAKNAIGLALSNPDLTMATPLKTLRGKNFTENFEALQVICTEYGIGGMVVGLPLNMDDSEGARAQSVRHFVFNLAKAGLDLPTAFMDERLSSHAVEQKLIEDLGMKRDKIREVIDAHAAAIILQDALEQLALTRA